MVVALRNERRETKLDGATAVSNSGRGFHKGDAILDGWLVDYKHIEKSFTLKKENWDKHAKDAWNEGHLNPLIKVIFGDEAVEVAIIDWNELQQMREIVWQYEELTK